MPQAWRGSGCGSAAGVALRLQRRLPQWTRSQIGRLRLIKKVGKTYKYYATSFGQRILLADLKLKEQLRLPTLSAA